jgi:hypothetical protein
MKNNKINWMFGNFIVVETTDDDGEGNFVSTLYLMDAPSVNNPETWGNIFEYMIGDPQNWTPGEVVSMDDFYTSNVNNKVVLVFKEDRPFFDRPKT